MSGAGSSSVGSGGKSRRRRDDGDGSDVSEQSGGSGGRGRGGKRGAPGELPSFLQLGEEAAASGRSSRSRESSASRSSSRSRSPSVTPAAPIPQGATSRQDIFDMVATVARNYGEEPEAEDLEPYGYRCYHCLCVACTPDLYNPKRHSLCAARSLAGRTSQITAL